MLKVPNKGLSKAWQVSKRHVAAYTGGKVVVSRDGNRIACMFSNDVAFLDTQTGVVISTIQQKIQVFSYRLLVYLFNAKFTNKLGGS